MRVSDKSAYVKVLMSIFNKMVFIDSIKSFNNSHSPLIASINFEIHVATFDESAGAAQLTLINIGSGNGTVSEYYKCRV